MTTSIQTLATPSYSVAKLFYDVTRLALILTLFVLGSCGSSTGGAQALPPTDHSASVFELSVLPESFDLGGSASNFYTTLEQSTPADNHDVVMLNIHVDSAQELKSVYLELKYDAQQYRAIVAQPTQLMGAESDMLSMFVPTVPGTIEYGQVLVHPDLQSGFNGSGVVAQVSFSNEPELLLRTLSNNGPNRSTRSQIKNLALDGSNLTWTYWQQGDYDQNGETNISDLTPIALHFKQTSPAGAGTPWPLTANESQVDGDSNGEINVSDLTPIGVNFKRDTHGGFHVFTSVEPGDYPADNPPIGANGAGAIESTPTAGIAVADADNYAARNTERIRYTFVVETPGVDSNYWVRPADIENTLGIASNIVGGGPAIPPTVSSTAPANSETGVPLNSSLAATFSHEMNSATVSTASFLLEGGTTSVAGSVSYNGVTALFNPDSSLEPATLYTATITTGVENLAGVALVNNYVWTFQTGTTPDIDAPTVSSTLPADSDTGVAINVNPTATFSEAMDPETINETTYTLTQASNAVDGDVTYAGMTATFVPVDTLEPDTLYTATITADSEDLAGNALASSHVWSFETSATSDSTPPTVISNFPATGATDVPVDVTLTASFSEAMNESSISASTFTLMQGEDPVLGTASYSGVVASFAHETQLAPGSLYTATITTGAQDLAGNALESEYTWSFTTLSTVDSSAPIVVSSVPEDSDSNVLISVAPSATFSEELDESTISASTFSVMQGLTPVPGNVSYAGLTATFTPLAELDTNTLYTATITTGAKDLAGNALEEDFIWSFTTVVADLGQAETFGSFGGGAGMTNQGILTVVNGDIGTTGVSTMITGFHDADGDVYTETPLNIGQVNGQIFTAPPFPGTAEQFEIATQAAADALIAFGDLSPASLPGGSDPGAGELGGLTLPPGVYKSAGGTFQITGSNLVLDAQGDPNAVWVFQAASSLTVGDTVPRSIILINGAQAKNVYWYVGSAATINGAGGGTMVGTIIASAGVTFSTAGNVTLTILDGRAIGLNASVTLVNTVINIP